MSELLRFIQNFKKSSTFTLYLSCYFFFFLLSAAWQKFHARQKSYVTTNEVLEDTFPVPHELQCMICARLLREAVITPCCQASFCDECTYRYCCSQRQQILDFCYKFYRLIRQVRLDVLLQFVCSIILPFVLFLWFCSQFVCCTINIIPSLFSRGLKTKSISSSSLVNLCANFFYFLPVEYGCYFR